MLCLTLMMTLMNKQTKQTASAACEQASSPLPLTPTSSIGFVSVSVSVFIFVSVSVCVCVSAVSLGHLTTMSVNGQMKVFAPLGRWKGARCGAVIAGATHKFYYHTQKLMIFHILYFEKKKVHSNCPLTRTSLAVSAPLSVSLLIFPAVCLSLSLYLE